MQNKLHQGRLMRGMENNIDVFIILLHHIMFCLNNVCMSCFSNTLIILQSSMLLPTGVLVLVHGVCSVWLVYFFFRQRIKQRTGKRAEEFHDRRWQGRNGRPMGICSGTNAAALQEQQSEGSMS